LQDGRAFEISDYTTYATTLYNVTLVGWGVRDLVTVNTIMLYMFYKPGLKLEKSTLYSSVVYTQQARWGTPRL